MTRDQVTAAVKAVLCCDCLRAPTFADDTSLALAQAGAISCVCGGELCGCESCTAIIAALEAGDFAGADLEGDISGIVSWSADGGVVEAV